jgi:hypothetical protein
MLGDFLGRQDIKLADSSSANQQRQQLVSVVPVNPAILDDVIRDMGHRPDQDRLGHTSLSWAISYASHSLAHCPATPDRTIIDISANGPNNDGPAPEAARDHALAMGHIINALAIPAPVLPPKDLAVSLDPDEGAWQHPTDYLYSHVTGGPNSFVTTTRALEDYSPVLRRGTIGLSMCRKSSLPGGLDLRR